MDIKTGPIKNNNDKALVLPRRKLLRLKEYDYSGAGLYFVTICTNNKVKILGEIINNEMLLNDLGRIVNDEWLKSAEIRSEIELYDYVIMPNHLHGIVGIKDTGDNAICRQKAGPGNKSLGAFVGGFKAAVTKQVNIIRKTTGSKVWQRNYYEHVIRNEKVLEEINQYIESNPYNWQEDKYF